MIYHCVESQNMFYYISNDIAAATGRNNTRTSILNKSEIKEMRN